jgi:hypothetical protein
MRFGAWPTGCPSRAFCWPVIPRPASSTASAMRTVRSGSRGRRITSPFMCRLCERLGADASTCRSRARRAYERADSAWANRHPHHLCRSRTLVARFNARLLPPYTTLDARPILATNRRPPENRYRPSAPIDAARSRAHRRTAWPARRRGGRSMPRMPNALQRKLNLWRWLLWALFPRGFAFEAGETRPWFTSRDACKLGCVSNPPATTAISSFSDACALTLKEALAHAIISDGSRHHDVRANPPAAPPRPAQGLRAFSCCSSSTITATCAGRRTFLRWLWSMDCAAAFPGGCRCRRWTESVLPSPRGACGRAGSL